MRDLRQHVGRRGGALLVLAVLYVLMGAALVATAEPPDPSDMILYQAWPMPVRAGTWWVAAAVAVWASTRRGPGQDRAGFLVAVVPLAIRSLSHLWSSVVWVVSQVAGDGVDVGQPHAWMTAAIWAGFAGLVVIIAGWAEVPEGYAPPLDDDGGTR